METSSSKILRNIPNMLTIFRIILIIPIIILFLIDTNFKTCYSLQIDGNTINIDLKYIIIALLFIIASISDFFDGYLSRKYHWQSNFGKFWDPLADKILVNVTFVLLAIVNFTHIGFVLVFIIRDIIVDGIRMYSSSKNIVLAADKFGKLKTFFQMISIIILLFFGSPCVVNWWYWGVLNLFVYFSILTSIISMLSYTFKFIKINKIKSIN